MFTILSHTSHILQPLDVGVYKPVKANWKKLLSGFYRSNGGRSIEKSDFPILLIELKALAFKRSHAVGGFEATGLE